MTATWNFYGNWQQTFHNEAPALQSVFCLKTPFHHRLSFHINGNHDHANNHHTPYWQYDHHGDAGELSGGSGHVAQGRCCSLPGSTFSVTVLLIIVFCDIIIIVNCLFPVADMTDLFQSGCSLLGPHQCGHDPGKHWLLKLPKLCTDHNSFWANPFLSDQSINVAATTI